VRTHDRFEMPLLTRREWLASTRASERVSAPRELRRGYLWSAVIPAFVAQAFAISRP
jgi:hypothetical protein